MFGEKVRADDTEMFNEVVNAILSVMGDDAVKIILYGSVARGDNTWESDVDIAVLTKKDYKDERRKKLHDVMFSLDWKYDTMFSVISIEEKHFKDWVDDLPFYHNIDMEGITLWTKKIA